MSRQTIQYLLNKHRINPRDERGQNFLTNDQTLRRIVKVANVQPEECIVEIGPGVGVLTAQLVNRARLVVAVEVDRRFEPILSALAAVNTNLRVVYQDILKTDFDYLNRTADGELQKSGYAIVANIPYYLTSKLIAQVLRYQTPPQRVVFLIQREVAERITAEQGDFSKLSLSVQMYGSPKVRGYVSRQDFYPQPQVDSAILEITDIHAWEYPEPEKLTWQLIAFGFSSKRKMLENNLAAGLRISKSAAAALLQQAGIEPGVRAEDVSVGQWLALVRAVQAIA